MNYKQEFVRIYNENIHRDGAAELLAWLERCDFFTAPASTKYHSSHEGGLCAHSVKVFNRLRNLVNFEYDTSGDAMPSAETVAICSLLHDICKANFYKASTRNVKNEETGAWEKQPYYAIDDQLPYGHGEKSVYMVSGFMRVSREEAMAIRWHMGASEDSHGNSAKAFSKYPLALMVHLADMQATFIDEKEGK